MCKILYGHIHKHTHAHIHVHSQAHAHARTLIHPPTNTHTHFHTYPLPHLHTHTHGHRCKSTLSSGWRPFGRLRSRTSPHSLSWCVCVCVSVCVCVCGCVCVSVGVNVAWVIVSKRVVKELGVWLLVDRAVGLRIGGRRTVVLCTSGHRRMCVCNCAHASALAPTHTDPHTFPQPLHSYRTTRATISSRSGHTNKTRGVWRTAIRRGLARRHCYPMKTERRHGPLIGCLADVAAF